MTTQELGRLQYLAGIIKEESHYIPKVILSESEEILFEQRWTLVEDELEQEIVNALKKKYKSSEVQSNSKEVTKTFLGTLKDIFKFIWKGLSGAPEIVFKNVNKLFWWVITSFLFKPFNALLAGIGIGAVVVYKALVSALNIQTDAVELDYLPDIPSINISAGDALDDSVMSTISAGWDKFVELFTSFEADGLAEAPIEIIMGGIGAGLEGLGLAVPAIIDATQIVGTWLLGLGLGNLAVAISWLYLIGGSIFLYKQAKKYLIGPLSDIIKKHFGKIEKDLTPVVNDETVSRQTT